MYHCIKKIDLLSVHCGMACEQNHCARFKPVRLDLLNKAKMHLPNELARPTHFGALQCCRDRVCFAFDVVTYNVGIAW